MSAKIFAVLDIGSTKITCFIAEQTDAEPKLIGFAQISSFGIKRGLVINMNETSSAIEQVVEQASNMAGVNIQSINICVGGISLSSKITDSLLILNNKSITQDDIDKLIDLAIAKHVENNKKIIHTIPIDFSLDDYAGIIDPTNMIGSKLEAKINIINSKQEPLNNVIRAVEMAGLYIDDIIASNVANGYSTLSPDEQTLGTCLIDFGGFSTDISIYYNGKLVLIDSVGLGSHHITSDIAHGLSVSIDDAERIKSLDGVATNSLIENGRSVEFVKAGEAKTKVNFVSQSFICSIIQPRTEEILELVKEKIAPYQHIFNNRIVITGGGSNLTGIADLAQNILNSQVRASSVINLAGTTNISSNSRFVTAGGAILYLSKKSEEKKDTAFKLSKSKSFLFSIKKALKNTFMSS